MALRAPRPPAPQIFLPTPARLPASSIPALFIHINIIHPSLATLVGSSPPDSPLPYPSFAFSSLPFLVAVPQTQTCVGQAPSQPSVGAHHTASHRNTHTHTHGHRGNRKTPGRLSFPQETNRGHTRDGIKLPPLGGWSFGKKEKKKELHLMLFLPIIYLSIYPSTEVIYHTVWASS